MKTLVTGGAGFIGSHLCEALLQKGDRVVALDNLSTGRLENVQPLQGRADFQLVVDSVLNEPVVAEQIESCDRVFHLAAAVGVKLIMERPVETIETNVRGTEIVLKSANRFSRPILITSTSEIYGKNKEGPLREDDDRIMGSVVKSRWAYANTKTLDEFLALAYYREKKLPAVVVRLFNTVGPRQSSQYGMVLPNFVQKALLGQPIPVFGTGRQTRNFTYVEDAVQAMIALMEHPQAVGQIFNIGNEEEISMRELAERVKKMTHSSSPIQVIPYEQAYGEGFEDMERRVPSLEKIRKVIGYQPHYDLNTIIQRVIDYYRHEWTA